MKDKTKAINILVSDLNITSLSNKAGHTPPNRAPSRSLIAGLLLSSQLRDNFTTTVSAQAERRTEHPFSTFWPNHTSVKVHRLRFILLKVWLQYCLMYRWVVQFIESSQTIAMAAYFYFYLPITHVQFIIICNVI